MKKLTNKFKIFRYRWLIMVQNTNIDHCADQYFNNILTYEQYSLFKLQCKNKILVYERAIGNLKI